MLDSCCISKRLSSQFIKDRAVSSLGVFVFEFLGSSFSSFWVLRFRDQGASFLSASFSIGASFSRFGWFVLRSLFSSASFSKLP